MTDRPDFLGTPTLHLAGLRLSVHGRAEPEADDYEYGNWLNVTVCCEARNAKVTTQGAILMAPDFARFVEQCEALGAELVAEAELSSYEPNLRVTIRRTGEDRRLKMRVEITPDHDYQRHQFDFWIQENDLKTITRVCSSVVDAYPVRGLGKNAGSV